MDHGKRRIVWPHWIATGLRWLLATLFLWAGVVKLADPKAFARNVDAFGIVPEPALVLVAIGIPLLEIFVAIAVALRWRIGLPLMAAQLLLFIAVLWFGMLNDLDVDCGCFSLAERNTHTSLKVAFWRDWIMLFAIAIIFILERKNKNRAGWPQDGKRSEHEIA